MNASRFGMRQPLQAFAGLIVGLCLFLLLAFRSRSALAAENLFLRKQLAFFQERKVRPRRTDNSTRWLLVTFSRFFNWRDALVVVNRKRS